MGYTIGEAAKATGKTKSTISKAIKSGRVSAARKGNGVYDIDPAELHRVYPPLSGKRDIQPLNGEREETGKIVHIKELEAKLEAAGKETLMLREQLNDLKQDRDHWRQQATALLTDQRPKSPEDRAGKWDIVVAVMLILAIGLLASQYWPVLQGLFIR